MKKLSIRWRITLVTGMVLLLCSIALTIIAFYNADKQLNYMVVSFAPKTSLTVSEKYETVLKDGQIVYSVAKAKGTYVTAKKQFNFIGIIAFISISVLGMGAVYFVTGKSLRPIHKLSSQVAAITESNLDERIVDENRTDEVGALCRSFNTMLERLSNSFDDQKRFSANVAHELKNPLATMNASVQVLHLEKTPTPLDYEQVLESVERNTKRLRVIVDDLMRLTDEGIQFEIETIHLDTLFSSIFTELTPLLADKHIDTEVNCQLLPVIKGNRSLLYQAFFNLLENAVKYNRDSGRITVMSLSESNNNIGEILISDTGSGIPSNELNKIFEPFYRVNKSRSRKTGGAGLGLSVVKTIIERHGWNITVESIEGKGTTFIIRLYLA